HFGVQILQPLRLCTAFGKPLIHIVAEASGDFAEYPVDGLALEPLATAFPLMNLMNDDGQPLFRLPHEERLPVFSPQYSRSTLM
ncbi:virulence factor SrfB, partial [Salmonella enterica subsp. enterica serovar Anatum]|nr:virulence factor SrfB [Salmonella enterica subsp. enterica serovar Anatum]